MSDVTRRPQTPVEDIAEMYRRIRDLEHRTHNHDEVYAPILPRIVNQGIVDSANSTDLANQLSHETVLTKSFSGLTAGLDYVLHAEGMCSVRPPTGGTDFRYQVRLSANGSPMQATLIEGPSSGSWTAGPVVGHWAITGVTSFDLIMTAYSYAPDPATGRAYYRNMKWTLWEV